ncbi:MAG: TadE/TadG family type IV pilus assembly protein [Candidatus Dormibacteraceae bacterium]
MKYQSGASGQTLIIFAIVLAFLLVGMLALVADLGTIFTTYTRADNLALLAAQAGSTGLSQGQFYNGQIALDPALAQSRCQQVFQHGAEGQQASCSVQNGEVVADIKLDARLPLPIFGVTVPIHVIRNAQPIYGDTKGNVGARLASPD